MNYKDMSDKLQDLSMFVETRSSAMASLSDACVMSPIIMRGAGNINTQESDYRSNTSSILKLR